MVEQTRTKTKKSTFSGNHQRSWLWGHHAVCETLLAGKWPVIEIFASPEAFEQSSELLLAKRKEGIPVEIIATSRLEQLSRSTEHQGVVVRLGPFPYQTVEAFGKILSQAVAAHANDTSSESGLAALQPLVVICDRIQDTFNFGAILRCCDGANVVGVVVGDRCQAEVTPHVARSSSGAVNHIPIIKVADLVASTAFVKELGLQVVAADANSQTSVWNSQLSCPTALVIGSEATGIQPQLLEICDQRLRIPMQGQVQSLNAAVATGILLYEIRRQQLSHVDFR